MFGEGSAPGDRVFLPLERGIYRICGIDSKREQVWSSYALSLLAFSASPSSASTRSSGSRALLPLNPNDFGAVPPPLAFNTAVSFVTNTNWQNYGGESTMTNLTQMAGLTVQNFVSAAVGLAVAVALIRGLVRRRSATIGNFWVDLTRGVVRVLLPLSILVALVLASQGVVQNFHGLHGGDDRRRRNAADPRWADREPGGDQGARHQRRRPVQRELGAPVREPDRLHGPGRDLRAAPDPVRPHLRVRAPGRRPAPGLGGVRGHVRDLDLGGRARHVLRGRTATPSVEALGAVGGNMEGKEVRFGTAASGLFAASTTGTSTGAVNSAHDSFTPIGGAVPLVHMMLGEVSPGGVGAGLYGMLVFALTAVFIAGLMVGRTPEYLGKKVQAAEMKLIVVYLAVVPLTILTFRRDLGRLRHGTRPRILNPGPHGLSEIVYAYTSASNNNGSAFGGLTGNTDWFNTTLGSRHALRAVPADRRRCSPSQARSPASRPSPPTAGTFPTNTPLFAALLTVVVLAVVGLTYFPVISLGPVLENLGP